MTTNPQAVQLKRYDIYWTPDKAGMNEEEAGGTWCKYAEAAERIAALEAKLAAAVRALKWIDDECGACNPSHDPSMPWMSICRIQPVARKAIDAACSGECGEGGNG